MASTIKLLQDDWQIEKRSRSEIVDLCRDARREVGGISVTSILGIVFLNHVAQTDADEFSDLLGELGDRNLETFKSSIFQLNSLLQNNFKPDPEVLPPIDELTQMAQIDSDDDEASRIEFENDPPNDDYEGILRAEIAEEE